MNIPKILMVEDSYEMQVLVKECLINDYQLKIVNSAKDLKDELKTQNFELIILDVELPDGDGFNICANLRADKKTKDIPIFFLTGKVNSRDKVMGFSVGGDDYIVKPIDPLEFRARVDAKMRSILRNLDKRDNDLRGHFRVSPALQKIFLITEEDEVDLNLSSNEFKLLYYFLRHEDHVLSREQILNEVWGADTHVTDRTVDTHVYMLRQKMGKSASWISSVHKIGYRFAQTEKKDAHAA